MASGVDAVAHCQKVSGTVVVFTQLGSHGGVEGVVSSWASSCAIFGCRYIGVVVTTSAKIVILLYGHIRQFSISRIEPLNRIIKGGAAIMGILLAVKYRGSRTFLRSSDTNTSSCLRDTSPISAGFSERWLKNRFGNPRIIDWQQRFVLGQLIHVHQILSTEQVSPDQLSLQIPLINCWIVLIGSILLAAIEIIIGFGIHML